MIEIYSTICAAIGGRDGMDGGRGFWMQYPINRIHYYFFAPSLLGPFGGAFGWDKNIFRIYYNDRNLFHHLCHHWGAGRDGWRQGILDVVSYKQNTLFFSLLHCWARLAGHLGGIKIYLGSTIMIKIYSTICAAIGGRDWMDGGRGFWMQQSINRIHYLFLLLRCWACLAGVLGREKI